MDKETLSNYGWVVICVMILAVMIALATPFGSFVAGAVKSTTAGLFMTNQNALGAAGIVIGDNQFADCLHENTEIRGANSSYTGDTYCTNCNAMTAKGDYIGEVFGLYQDGAIEIYKEQGIDAIKGMQIMSWDYLIANGYITIVDGVMTHTCQSKSRAVWEIADFPGDLIIHPDAEINAIADNGFDDCVVLTGILLPDSVRVIGDNAFARCRALDNINLDKVTSIGTDAFLNTKIN